MTKHEMNALQRALLSEKHTKEIYRTAAAQADDHRIKQIFLQLARCNQNQQERLFELLSQTDIQDGLRDLTPDAWPDQDGLDTDSKIPSVSNPNEAPGAKDDGSQERFGANGSILPGIPDRVILDRIFDGVLFVDPEGKIRFWNLGAERITGYSPDEVVGRNSRDLGLSRFKGDLVNDSAQLCPTDDVFDAGLPKESRFFFPHKRGHRFPVDILTTPIIHKGALIGAVLNFRDVTAYDEIEAINRRLNDLAFTDSLTGMPSRRWILEQLSFSLKQIKRHKSGMWIGMLDVDEFKRINDRYGHFTGDMVLVEIANRVSSKFRDSDIFGRMGGDEFLFAFLNSARDDEDILTKRISEGFADLGPPILPEAITVSVGMAAFRPDEDKLVQTCIERADGALMEAKKKGRNQLVLVN